MKSSATSVQPRQINWPGLLNLLIVYIIWGSTYLGIRIAVKEGSGFPPFFLAGSRVLIAGTILMTLALLQKQRIRLTRREVILLAISGTMLWLGGNGLVTVAEQHVHSGITALVIGATPISVAIMESIIDRRPPTKLLVASLLIGITGVGLLSAPSFQTGIKADATSIILLIVAGTLWGGGSLLQSRMPVQVAPEVSSAYQHLFGAVGLISAALLTREPFPQPTTDAIFAWGYLIIFGSVIAFTAFVRVLHMLPTNIVMTYAYVNPVIAVILGWVILREPVTGWTIGGMLLILLGVAGVFRARVPKPTH